MNKITGDITEMAAQIPALFETLSGMKMSRAVLQGADHRRQSPRPDDKSKGAGA